MKIELMKEAHWPQVKDIYTEGINTGNATFEEYPPGTWQEWSQKHLASCSLVCVDDSKVVGWAAISPISSRSVYRGVGEVSVYISSKYMHQGIGYALLNELIHESEEHGFWTLQAGIFPENQASLDLHQKLGFEVVGTRQKIGKMRYGSYQGQWRDVIFLERRSLNVGIN